MCEFGEEVGDGGEDVHEDGKFPDNREDFELCSVSRSVFFCFLLGGVESKQLAGNLGTL